MQDYGWLTRFSRAVMQLFLVGLLHNVSQPVLAASSLNTVDDQNLQRLEQTLTLDKAVNLVLERNPDMHIAKQRIAIAEAQLGERLAAFYPQVKARFTYEYTDNPARAFAMIVAQRGFSNQDFLNINNPGGTTDFRPEVIGTLSLFNGGRDYQRSKVAELGVEITELNRIAIRNNLIQAVTDAYYALLVAIENNRIAMRSIDAVDKEFKYTEIRFQGGSALKSDVLSLQVQLAKAREMQIRAENIIEISRSILRTLLDLAPSSPVEVIELQAALLPKPDMNFEQLLAQAESGRPELNIAAKKVEIQQRKLKIAQGEYLPRLNAFVNYGTNNEAFGSSSNRENVTAGVALEMDIFSGFGTQQRTAKAQRELATAKEQLHKLRLQINQEVKNAYLLLTEAIQRRKVTETAMYAAEEALRLVSAQHQAGTVTVTRFIEAQVARDQANARTIAALYDALRAEAVIKRAIGEWP